MRRALLAAVLLAGCGGSAEAPYEFETMCFVMHAGKPINEAATEYDVALMQRLLRERLGITFCGKVGTVRLILTEGPFEAFGDPHVGGMDIPFENAIILVRHLASLLHECLHLWDFQHVAVGSLWHQGWDQNGYNATSAEYVRRMRWATHVETEE